MRHVFIVNTSAGKGKCQRRWEMFYQGVKANLGDHSVFFTKKPGEAQDIAHEELRKNEQDETVVIAVGGDGTANEVLNGVAGSQAAIGILPFGTGNDLAKALQIPKDLTELIDQYNKKSHQIKKINVGKMNGRYFASAAGIGFDGVVADFVNKRPLMKNLGTVGYLVGALGLAGRFVPVRFEVTLDGEAHVFSNTWLLVVGNGPYFGGGMKICPAAQFEDGVFDLCVVNNLSKPRFFKLFPSVYKGTHTREAQSVHMLRGRTIIIKAENPMMAHADGEFIEAQTLHIEMCAFNQSYFV